MGIALGFALAAVIITAVAQWIWGWTQGFWDKLYTAEKTGWLLSQPRKPSAGFGCVPALAVATWAAVLGALLAAVIFPNGPAPRTSEETLFLVLLFAPYALPVVVLMFQWPKALLPPGARRPVLVGRAAFEQTELSRRPKYRRPTAIADELVLSGFPSEKAYKERRAGWEPDESFSVLSNAESAARQWIATQGDEAQVEIIRVTGSEGRVIEVVTQKGVETIQS
jgi:hypothetical protein